MTTWHGEIYDQRQEVAPTTAAVGGRGAGDTMGRYSMAAYARGAGHPSRHCLPAPCSSADAAHPCRGSVRRRELDAPLHAV